MTWRNISAKEATMTKVSISARGVTALGQAKSMTKGGGAVPIADLSKQFRQEPPAISAE